MRKSKFTEKQIAEILRETDAGKAVAEVAQKNNICAATLYQWRAKYGGISVPEMQRLRGMREENSLLKRQYADLHRDNMVLREALQKKF